MSQGEAPAGFIFGISIWLWFTVLFANFAEAMAEGRGKAQADALRRARRDVMAKKLHGTAAAMRGADVGIGHDTAQGGRASWSRRATRFPPTAK